MFNLKNMWIQVDLVMSKGRPKELEQSNASELSTNQGIAVTTGRTKLAFSIPRQFSALSSRTVWWLSDVLSL